MCSGLEGQLQQAQQHAEQFKSIAEANESALSGLNKVSEVLFKHILKPFCSPVYAWRLAAP